MNLQLSEEKQRNTEACSANLPKTDAEDRSLAALTHESLKPACVFVISLLRLLTSAIFVFSPASLPDGEEAPPVYIRPVCAGSVTAHQGQLPRDDRRNNLRPCTKDPGRFGKTNLVS